MKRIFKIIFISLACVIGALGVAVGGAYLFGAMNEKPVYAENMAFSQSEVISAETIYMQINTTTQGLTENTIKLITDVRSSNIIEFPETVKFGETFAIVPKRVNGVNTGGNVTLNAEYTVAGTNVSLSAKCEILIDVPVESVDFAIVIDTTTPNQTTSIYLKDNELSSALNIFPKEKALMPYLISGTKKVNNILDKVMYLELVNSTDNIISTDVATFKLNGIDVETNRVKVNYSYRDVDNDGDYEIVFDDTLSIFSKPAKADVRLKAYLYPTYKEQNKNTIDGALEVNKNAVVSGDISFKIGDYKVSNMTIVPTTTTVKLKEETKVYINNPSVTGNDINLGINLETDSPGITVDDEYILKNIYISIDDIELTSLTKVNLDEFDKYKTEYGLGVNFEGIDFEKDKWHWVLNVDDFEAYKNYRDNGKPLVVTITYFDDEEDVLYQHSFDIITTIVEVDSLTINYPQGGDGYIVKSGENLQINSDDVVINFKGNNPNDDCYNVAYYISYDKNFEKGYTTVNTVPNVLDKYYKASFDFYLTKDLKLQSFSNISAGMDLKYVTFIQGGATEVYITNGDKPNSIERVFIAGEKISVVIEFILTSEINVQNLFNLTFGSGSTTENINIKTRQVKFYEQSDEIAPASEATQNNGETNTNSSGKKYKTIPYLVINNVRYNIDFEYFYDERTSGEYLAIDKTKSAIVEKIGSFYITIQSIYKEANDNNIYWLGKSIHVKVEVYQELDNLQVYSYNKKENSAEYDKTIFAENTSFVENSSDKNYIFITSSHMDALTNYAKNNEILISFAQVFIIKDKENKDVLINIADYPGIENINKKAITFGDSWDAVYGANGEILGFVNYYKVNSVYAIYIEESKVVDITYNISISLKVNNKDVNGLFNIYQTVDSQGKQEAKETTSDKLPIKIVDKSINKSYLALNGTTSNDATNKFDNPIEISASLNSDGDVTYSGLNSLEYYFKEDLDNTDSSKTISTMAYDITVEDKSGVNPNGLYSFNLSNEMKGGLNLYNFPEFFNKDTNKSGVTIKLKIYSSKLEEFNSHFIWKGDGFKQTKNNGLEASLFIRVKGLGIAIQEVKVEGNKTKEIIGNKNDTYNLFGDILTLAVNDSSGNINVKDYSKFMTAVVNNQYVELIRETDGNGNVVPKIKLTKDFIKCEDLQISFYIGSNANKVSMSIDGESKTEYIKNINPALTINDTKTFNIGYGESDVKPNTKVNFAEITYNGSSVLPEGIETNVILVSTTLPTSEGVENAISVVDNNKLIFKITTNSYNAVIKLAIRNNVTNDYWEQDYYVTINSKYKQDLIDIKDNENNSVNNLLTAGVNEFKYVKFNLDSNEEAVLKSNLESISVDFVNAEANDNLLASKHMVFDDTNYTIWSDDLNYDKLVNVVFTLNFDGGGKFVINKTLTIEGNLELSLLNADITYSNGSSILILTDESKYNFKVNNVLTPLDFVNFEYDNNSVKFNKNTFTLSEYLVDSSSEADYDSFVVKAKPNSSLEGLTIQTYIIFNYVTDSNYILKFNLPISITYNYSLNTLEPVVFEQTDNENAFIITGENNAISTTNGIIFNGYLNENKKDISDIILSFEDTNDSQVTVEDMHYSYNKTTNELKIWSTSSDEKEIKVDFVFELENGSKILYTNTIKVTI